MIVPTGWLGSPLTTEPPCYTRRTGGRRPRWRTLRLHAAPVEAPRCAVSSPSCTKRSSRGTLGDLATTFATRSIKGEVAIVVSGSSADSEAASLADGRRRVERLVTEGVKRSAAARLVAEDTGLPRRELFAVDDT